MASTWFTVGCYCAFLLLLRNPVSLNGERFKDEQHSHLRNVSKKIIDNFMSLSKPVLQGSGSTATRRPPKLDIIFALDASRASSDDFFEYQKNLTRVLIEGFSVSPSNARVVIVSCASSYTHFNFGFKAFVNKECVTGFIPTLRYQNKSRALGDCLRSIHWQVFVMSPERRKEAKKVIFVISTGRLKSSPSVVARRLKDIGVEIYGLSIRLKHIPDGYHQLKQSVSRPASKHIFRVPSIQSIKRLVRMLKGKGYYATICKKRRSHKFHDECRRICECKNGRIVNCTRVRHEFTTMSSSNRLLFIKSFKKITTDKKIKKEFKELVKVYKHNFSKYIHTKRYFLPWHRAFLLKVENLLRRVDCRVTIPYWDWTLTSRNPWRHSTNDIWSASRGLGGNGTSSDGCVKTGPFRKGRWKIEKLNGIKSCIRRKFNKNAKFPNIMNIHLALGTPEEDFKKFEFILRVGYHHIVTCAVGGTMCSVDQVWTPEYFLIISFIDKLWGKWQSTTPSRWPTGFPVVSDLLPGFSDYIGEILQLRNQPRCVSVKYDNPEKRLRWIMNDLWHEVKEKSPNKNPETDSLVYSKRAEELYGLTEIERIHFLHVFLNNY